METLHFTVFINAPKQYVWETMLTDNTYREWAAQFHEGSHFVGDWNTGSDIRFLGPDEDGSLSGLCGTIVEARPYDYVSIEYYGEITRGIEKAGKDETPWAGARESYNFVEKNGGTEVVIDVDVTEEVKDIMAELWPKALLKLKEITERS